jgi:hypothetical protein
MQSDFTGGENIDQEKLSGGYGDGEMNLASLEQIDQRRLWWGSRTEREVDDFQDGEADELDTEECGWDDLCEGEEPGFEGYAGPAGPGVVARRGPGHGRSSPIVRSHPHATTRPASKERGAFS